MWVVEWAEKGNTYKEVAITKNTPRTLSAQRAIHLIPKVNLPSKDQSHSSYGLTMEACTNKFSQNFIDDHSEAFD